jgi:uncharacterized protein (TIGR02099 family)
LQHTFVHNLNRILWVSIISLVVLLAAYVSLGRVLMASVSQYEAQILAELNHRVPFTVEAGGVSGDWHSFSPGIVLSDLRLSLPGSTAPPLVLAQGRLSLDVFDILVSRSLQVSRLHLEELSLLAEISKDGKFQLVGLSGRGGLDRWLREFLLNMEQVSVTDVQLDLGLPDGSSRELQLDLDLEREGGRRTLAATLSSSHGTVINALATGLGNPFNLASFDGQLYLDIEAVDLVAAQAVVPLELPLQVSGGVLDLELWLTWENGTPNFEGLVAARDMQLGSPQGDWQLPLEELTFAASLVERRNRWTLFASDLLLRKSGHDLYLPRVQLDAWGDSLRLRTESVSLASLNRALVDLPFIPHGLQDTLKILQPDGDLSALELLVADINKPSREWGVRANFSELVLDSWRGAPGASAGSGYVELDESGGFVVVDARQMTLDFPTVYHEPLAYEDIHGTVYINWYEDAVVLSSGLITAHGDEGEVNALFGLNIPLQPTEVGLEMDLLVSLKDAEANNRNKYLPFTLSQSLLTWLQGSISKGKINEGGFLWRGSLRKDQSRARTVQLFFDVSDMAFTYHEDWPPVHDLQGLVLIDDTNISIWSERARLFNTDVTFLTAESWIDSGKEIMLDLKTSTSGLAEDGLRVVHQSPLNGLTGEVFADWRFAGQLQTDLALQLNISDSSVPPAVELQTRPSAAQLKVDPGGLVVEDINGELRYSSASGFSASDLKGVFWGEPIDVTVRQHSVDTQGYTPATSSLEVSFDTDLELAKLQQWLDLDILGRASGRTRAQVSVTAPPGEAPHIRITSDMAGAALDLPQPWQYAEEDRVPLEVDAYLKKDAINIGVVLDDRLQLNLDLVAGRLRAGALGVQEPALPLKKGYFRIAGLAPYVNVEQWQALVGDVVPANSAAEPRDADDAGELAPADSSAAVAELPNLSIESLQIETLDFMGQDLRDVIINAAQEDSGWQLAAEMEGLQGELELAGDLQGSRLTLTHLELASLGKLQFGGEEEGGDKDWNLPNTQVIVRELYRNGSPQGELSFDLEFDGALLRMIDVRGEFAGLQLTREQGNELRWNRAAEGMTAVEAEINFTDLGTILETFEYQRVVETSGGEVDFSLQWPGSPMDFSLQGASGVIGVQIDQGRFPDNPPGAASGALRVVSILNLAEIVSRLSMSHMFESGIPFRELKGDFKLSPGLVEVPSLDVNGASSRFIFSGSSVVADKSLFGEMVVTLPVANNLPWVAALAVGLPVAAGVFVVSKVFEKQVNQLSSAVYDIDGSWNDPQVSFSHIFDVEEQAAAASIDSSAETGDEAAASIESSAETSDVATAASIDSSAEAGDVADEAPLLPAEVLLPQASNSDEPAVEVPTQAVEPDR